MGETWPSPDGDLCKKVACVQNKLGEVVKQESVETCKVECKKGWEYVPSNETCCGECEQVACLVDDELKKPGDKWASPDGCTLYTCERIGNQFTVSTFQESCPNVDDCPEENIYFLGCCKHCNFTVVDQGKPSSLYKYNYQL